MKIRCQNFGPIVDGEIDINKDLILLCGKNNSGKSYITYLLYDLLNGSLAKGGNVTLPDTITPFVPLENIRVERTNNPVFPLTAFFTVDLPQLMLSEKATIEQALGAWLKYRLPVLFPDTENFQQTTFEVHLLYDQQIQDREYQRAFRSEFIIKLKEEDPINFVRVQFDKQPRQKHISFQAQQGQGLTTDLTKEIIGAVHLAILNVILLNAQSQTFHDAYYFPAERIGLDMVKWDIVEARPQLRQDMQARHTYAYLKNSIAGQQYGMSQRPPNPLDTDRYYPLPIRDFIIRSTTYPFYINTPGALAKLGNELEEKIGGQMDAKDTKVVSLQVKNGNSIPLKLASSTVKSLASFILYLKHEAQPGDAVFFDEPELCLHPTLQRKLAVILARLVGEGLKLIIATHSDFMLREFNTLIMLSAEGEKAKKLRVKYSNLGYSLQSILNPSIVGVTIFGNGKMELTPVQQDGFDVSAIDDEIASQNSVSEDIYFTLF